MDSGGSERNDQPRAGRVLSDHKQVKKRFIPPLLQLGNFEEVSWVDLIIPEVLWLALLNHRHGIARGAALALALAKVADGLIGEKSRPLFSRTSDYAALSGEEWLRLLSALDAADLDAIRVALAPLVGLYPECPLRRIFELPPTSEQAVTGLPELKALLSAMFDRTSVPATFAQANVLDLAFVLGRMTVAENVSLANFPAIEQYPATEESQRFASSVRASVLVFFGAADPPDPTWSRYFWNRGLELEPCDFGEGGSSDDR